MSAPSKIKWFGSITLGCILLALAMMGGKWGTTYTADAGVNAAPTIESIIPSAVPSGSANTLMIIIGSNFGDLTDTRVRLLGIDTDLILTPQTVIPNGISVIITDTLLVEPTAYILTVIKSTFPSIPTVPITPWDEVSNAVTFTVFNPQFFYFPLINK